MGIKAGNVVQTKIGTVARTDTSAKYVFVLPPNSMIIGVQVLGTASDAGTSATLTFKNTPINGSAAAATFATTDAKTATGTVANGSLSGISFTRTDVGQKITAEYAEVGTASTTGGSWTFVVKFV